MEATAKTVELAVDGSLHRLPLPTLSLTHCPMEKELARSPLLHQQQASLNSLQLHTVVQAAP